MLYMSQSCKSAYAWFRRKRTVPYISVAIRFIYFFTQENHTTAGWIHTPDAHSLLKLSFEAPQASVIYLYISREVTQAYWCFLLDHVLPNPSSVSMQRSLLFILGELSTYKIHFNWLGFKRSWNVFMCQV